MKKFFILKKNVNNPAPDRRSKHQCNSSVWKEGTLLEVFPAGAIPGQTNGTIYFPDNTCVSYDPSIPFSKGAFKTHGNELAENWEPAPETVGLTLVLANYNAKELLAYLIHTGAVTLNQVKVAITQMDAMQTLGELESICEQHNLG